MKHQAPVAQKMDSTIHWINHHLVNKYWENQLHYPVHRDLSGRWHYPSFEQLRPAGATFNILSVTFHICQHEGVGTLLHGLHACESSAIRKAVSGHMQNLCLSIGASISDTLVTLCTDIMDLLCF